MKLSILELTLAFCLSAILSYSSAEINREAYFNGTAYLRYLSPMQLWDHAAISFRSCKGGEILSQRHLKHTLLVSVSSDSLIISLHVGKEHSDTRIPVRLLDNKWHILEFLYRLGDLNLIIDHTPIVIANATHNSGLLTDDELRNDAAVLIIGNMFSGCLLQGPGLIFNTSLMRAEGVVFGPCPLPLGSCNDQSDTTTLAPIDHCLNEPCMQHGSCFSRPDTYECHCYTRYSGRNCQIDNGPPCESQPCHNGATCQEDTKGNYMCYCTQRFSGKFCEKEIVLHPLCEKNPCFNNGTCRVPTNSQTYECECPEGFTGTRCETDKDDCEEQPCLNGGICRDETRGFLCECTDTGYSGTLCQHNINECLNNPCSNGGLCFDTYGSYICECPTGYGGMNCEFQIDECQSQPCRHGGTCHNRIDHKDRFECICPIGYSGTYCEFDPPCPPCPPDSECISGRCVCKSGSSGLVGRCIANSTPKSAKTNACASYCLNGATCTGSDAANTTCICPSGYTGTQCETPMALAFSDECRCLNGGICDITTSECICPPGFDGTRCERALDSCNTNNCPEPMTCIGGKCLCPDGENCGNIPTQSPPGPCASQPCLNGAQCHANGNDFICECAAGWNGTTCANRIDECIINTTCIHGICNNQICYCLQGYSGRRCDLDVDECLSMPCKNGASCINQINDFECICLPGYTGKECAIDIDECADNPCFTGSTCMDLVANFTCICMPGMTGRRCEIDIDDCESQPCQHNGHCRDKLGSFECECAGTGYTGEFCDVNIDECLSNPCQNGALCTDHVNNYTCDCYAGYEGQNCDIDINECGSNPCRHNATCLEHSNMTIFSLPPDERRKLPEFFWGEFSYANASGYECICVKGITGKNCETNINECESNPCSKYGTCIDDIGRYSCECEAGFTGVHCEIDIDECDLYKPCEHGTCIDGRDNYLCDCDTLYGGKNCSVYLTGCENSPCSNNGTCWPYLENEKVHKFNCTCHPGFQGSTCDRITTMSLVNNSLITVNTSREEGYEIHLRFKTTLPDGILAFGNGNPYSYILELVNGRLNLHSSLLNKWEGVFIGSQLNDSEWQKVFVTINSSHLVLSANEEQTIYPINAFDSTNASHPTFPTTSLGGTIPNLYPYLRHLPHHNPTSFVGCMEDVVINGEWVFPEVPSMYTTLREVGTGCPRTAQCDPNPCHSNGLCSDLWHTFSCTCQRPHLGSTCKYNITAATFGNENTTNSAVIVDINDRGRRAIRSILDISMFIRTRQAYGYIFYLGSDPRKINTNPTEKKDSYVSAKLKGGEFVVRIQFNGTPEEYTVGGNKVDNAHVHLIQVIRNLTLVQVKLNGTEYFRKTLSSTGQLDAQVLYLGGPAPLTDDSRDDMKPKRDERFFKGIIQDVQVSNGSHAMTVEFFPLKEEDLNLPPPLGAVTINNESVLQGEVSDDECQKTPCNYGASCKNTWNDFVCICPLGYKGRLCEDIEFCELNDCPDHSVCQNLDDGFECISNITLQGKEMVPLEYDFVRNDTVESKKPISIQVSYRSKTGGTMLYVQDDEDMYFEVSVDEGEIKIQWRLLQPQPMYQAFANDTPNFDWVTLYIQIDNGKLEGGWKGWEGGNEPAISTEIDQNAMEHLFSGKYKVYLSGLPDSNTVLKKPQATQKFRGCLGEVRINKILLPFFPHNQIYPKTLVSRSHYTLNSAKPEQGCMVCFENECHNGGKCSNPSETYACECPVGYAKDDCSENINECLEAMCANNSTCIDGIGNYTCDCLLGYDGLHCENEINECESNPCHNGGICTDLIGNFSCECHEDFSGPQCDILKLVTCENQPCHDGSSCIDGLNLTTGNNFTCNCLSGRQGFLCETPFCTVQPCQNDGNCLTKERRPTCQCLPGYMGRLCEININECDSEPCQNHGTCEDRIAGYLCNCANTGFEGLNCETDINECLTDQNDCGPKRLCNNTEGSYKCQCPRGSCGPNCDVDDPCLAEEVCQNDGVCLELCTTVPDYTCNCSNGFGGKNCTEIVAPIVAEDNTGANIALIVIPIVVVLLIIGGSLLVAFLVMARNKRATRGTYSPSAQEYCNPRLEMDNVLKPPPEERLI